uniref:Uncharacterized protein n=1 Tax=Plectus sambesii TaxID=2011161 RepID=A0A914VQV3_9BILA
MQTKHISSEKTKKTKYTLTVCSRIWPPRKTTRPHRPQPLRSWRSAIGIGQRRFLVRMKSARATTKRPPGPRYIPGRPASVDDIDHGSSGASVNSSCGPPTPLGVAAHDSLSTRPFIGRQVPRRSQKRRVQHLLSGGIVEHSL